MRRILVITFVLLWSQEASARKLAFHGLQWLGVEADEQSDALARVSGALDRGADLLASPEVAEMCGGSMHCHCEAARRRGATAAVYGNVSRLGDLVTVELILVDAHGCEVENAEFRSTTLAAGSGALPAHLGSLASELVTPPATVSTTAVKTRRTVDTIPVSVHVVTRDEMLSLGIRRLEELLDIVPGWSRIPMNWGTRVLHQELPGTVLVMVDGVPLTDPYAYFGVLEQDFDTSLHHVERVEFVRGPASVMWGGQAFMGVINIITRAPKREGTSGEVGIRAGTGGGYEVHGHVAEGRPRLRYGLSASVRRGPSQPVFVEDSPFAMIALTPETPTVWGHGGTTDPVADEYYDVVATVQVGERFTAQVHQVTYENYFEISPFGSLLDSAHPGRWERTHRVYRLDWRDTLPGDVGYQITGSRYELTWYDDFEIHPAHAEGHPGGLQVLQGNRVEPTITHQVEAKADRSFAGGRHRLMAGTSWMRHGLPDSYATMLTATEEAAVPMLDIASRSLEKLGAFAYGEAAWSADGGLSVGTRFEHWSTGVAVWTHQAAAVQRIGPTTHKLIYAEGFRPPLANAMYSTVGVQGQPDLAPERSRSVLAESTVRVGEPLTLRIGGSATWISDLVVLDPDAADEGFVSRPVNSGSLRVDSAFALGRLETRVIDLYTSVTVNHHTEKDPGHDIAPWGVQAALVWRPMLDVSAYARGTVSAPRTVSVVTAAGPVPELREVPATPSLDLGFSVRNLYRNLHLEVSFKNPLRFEVQAPYRIDGAPTAMVEQHVESELMVGLTWTP